MSDKKDLLVILAPPPHLLTAHLMRIFFSVNLPCGNVELSDGEKEVKMHLTCL